jgi:PHD/YefM family antitoxin component YafN of YafNO toxin-antitoxin module
MGKEPEVISVTDLRNSTREVIENAHFRGRRYLVERAGQPMMVALGVDDYRQLTDARNARPEAWLSIQRED